jgi:hypothetical protein
VLQQLVLRDQSNGRFGTQALVMDWQEGVPLTPRTLICERVRIEWDAREHEREAGQHDHPAPLVDEAMMRRRNPFRRTQVATPSKPAAATTPFTLESVTELALDGFVRNAFFLLVDGRQIADLDELIPLRPQSQVTFVRLMPLKGG